MKKETFHHVSNLFSFEKEKQVCAIYWKMFYFERTKLFGMTLKARTGSCPFLLRSSQGIKVSIVAISANDLGEQTLVS